MQKDDVIYRQAAINAFGDVHPLDYNAIAVRDKIRALPSAEPERKRGRYIKGKNGEWYCSECKRIDDKYSVANFCWYCGADMRGGQDEHID